MQNKNSKTRAYILWCCLKENVSNYINLEVNWIQCNVCSIWINLSYTVPKLVYTPNNYMLRSGCYAACKKLKGVCQIIITYHMLQHGSCEYYDKSFFLSGLSKHMSKNHSDEKENSGKMNCVHCPAR